MVAKLKTCAGSAPNGLLALLYALTIAGFPLATALPVALEVDSQLVTVPFRGVVVFLVIWVLLRAYFRGERIFVGAPFVLFLVLWIILLSRIAWDVLIQPLVQPLDLPAGQFVLLSVGTCFMPAVAFVVVPNSATIDRARVLTECIAAIAMIALAWLGISTLSGERALSRLSTEVLNPIAVGYLGVSAYTVSIAGVLYSRTVARRGTGMFVRLIRKLVVCLALAVTIASFSRGPILCALAVTSVLILTHSGALSPGKALLVRSILVVLICAVAWRVVLYLDNLQIVDVLSRFRDPIGRDASSLERLEMFAGAWRQFADHPFIGSAVVELTTMSWPHNMLLEAMMMAGVLGFLLLLMLLVAGTSAAWQLVKSGPGMGWIGLIYIQSALALMLSGSMLFEGKFWAFLLASVALASAVHQYTPGLPSLRVQTA